ncbi:MAG: PIG-L family deacetylase [Bdellovibrionales bacterium]|nr:PIG-L family deacetylase [Bdellovibrionales bacterium]
MSKRKHKLIIVSHPDDESLFFAGLMLSEKSTHWTVVCATDGNADGHGHKRMKQFSTATKLLGAKKIICLDLQDKFNKRLDQKTLKEKLSELSATWTSQPDEVYTHGPIGEYGHPHHQDISLAVHNHFHKKSPVYSIAHNCKPDRVIKLSATDFRMKTKVLSNIYFSETERFINFVPATAVECFVKLKLREVQNIYNHIALNKKISPRELDKYLWFLPYFKSMKIKSKSRPF